MHRLLIALALCVVAVLDLAAAQAATLDGQRFAVAFADATGKAQDSDELVFADGTLALPALEKRYRFRPGVCAVTGSGGDLAFTATLTSPGNGRIVVAGTVAGGRVTGTRTWGKDDKQPIIHTFAAKR